MREELLDRRMLRDAPFVHEQHLVAEPPRLAEVVGRHDHLRSRRIERPDHALDLARRGRVEARGRLVEEQHLRVKRPRPRQRQALLLAAREHARRAVLEMRKPDALERFARDPLALAPADARELQRIRHVGERAAPEQHRPLEHHRLQTAAALAVGIAPRNPARGRREQSVHQAHQHALAGAICAEHDRAGSRFEAHGDAVEDRALAGDEADVAQLQRQDAPVRRHQP
jgi:hypothetical protein